MAELARPGELTFAGAVSRALRESRRRQNLTHADVAGRTQSLVSKAALANYETKRPEIRVDVLWVITRALGEDLGQFLAAVEREVEQNQFKQCGPMTLR